MKIKYSVWYVAGFRPSAEAEVAQINCNWPKAFLLQDKNRIGPNKNFLDCVLVKWLGGPQQTFNQDTKPQGVHLLSHWNFFQFLFVLFFCLLLHHLRLTIGLTPFFLNAFQLVSSYSLFIIIIFFLMLLFASHMTVLDLSNWLDLIGLPCSFTLPCELFNMYANNLYYLYDKDNF